MAGIFLASWTVQSVAGWAVYNEERLQRLQDPIGWGSYLTHADFWSRSLQNWQSEFLAVGSMAVLADLPAAAWLPREQTGRGTAQQHRHRGLSVSRAWPGRTRGQIGHGADVRRRRPWGVRVRAQWESGPASLVLVRHGESMGNLADTQAARERGRAPRARPARRRRPAVADGTEASGGAGASGSASNGTAARAGDQLALPAGRGHRSPARGRVRRRARARRAAARARPRRLRRPDRAGIRSRLPGGGGATEEARQVLLPAPVRGELVRRGAAGPQPARATCAGGTRASRSAWSRTRR